MENIEIEAWKQCTTQVFWGEIAPCDHIVQIYENDSVFIDSLEGFVVSGLRDNDSIVIIATPVHLEALKIRLSLNGYNIPVLCKNDQLILLDAEETLGLFMVDGWPDANLFNTSITKVISRARMKAGKVRAFGEMVAILWAKGQNGATVQLEHLWNEFMHSEAFSLFCAYPKSGFTQDATTSLKTICQTHSKIIQGGKAANGNIRYKRVS